MNQDKLIEEAAQAAFSAPRVAPTEWLMVGMTCSVQVVDAGSGPQKALVFWHQNGPDGVRFVFPMSDAGARGIGDQLAGRPSIVTPGGAL